MPDTATRTMRRPCPSCQMTLKVSAKLFGKKFKCSKCGTVLEFDKTSGQLIHEPQMAELLEDKFEPIDQKVNNTASLWLIVRYFVFCIVLTLIIFWFYL